MPALGAGHMSVHAAPSPPLLPEPSVDPPSSAVTLPASSVEPSSPACPPDESPDGLPEPSGPALPDEPSAPSPWSDVPAPLLPQATLARIHAPAAKDKRCL